MPVAAQAYSYLKEFKFRCELNGLPACIVQEFDPGNQTIAIVEHAGAGQNHPVKEAGMLKYENAVLRNVVPTDGPGGGYWNEWMTQEQDPETGDGSPPSGYMRNFTVYELGADGNPVRAWEFFRAFIVEYRLQNRSGLSDNKNVIEEVHIAYDSRRLREISTG